MPQKRKATAKKTTWMRKVRCKPADVKRWDEAHTYAVRAAGVTFNYTQWVTDLLNREAKRLGVRG